MPRTARKRSAYGYYHVILRGIDRQVLFYEDEDRRKLLNSLKKYTAENNITVIAYALMDNHIHLLLKSEDKSVWADNLARFVKQVSSSYVKYFNTLYDRTGHLFQERFHSEPVESGRYLLTVMRYILQNPAKAGLGAMDQYKWSSYGETFLGCDGFCDAGMVIKTAGGLENLRTFVAQESKEKCLEYHRDKLVDDKKALELIRRAIESDDVRVFTALSKAERDSCIVHLRSLGVTSAQIARLTGLNRSVVAHARKE